MNNDNFWMYLFLMCRVLYAPMRVLRLADQQTASMDKLYFYVLQTDWMLMKWLPDCKKKPTELLRDTSLSQVMTNCDADIDWGSKDALTGATKDPPHWVMVSLLPYQDDGITAP